MEYREDTVDMGGGIVPDAVEPEVPGTDDPGSETTIDRDDQR